jgi:hypothetical protein
MSTPVIRHCQALSSGSIRLCAENLAAVGQTITLRCRGVRFVTSMLNSLLDDDMIGNGSPESGTCHGLALIDAAV